MGCPNVTIVDEGDVTACKLFYRDQCLFGMADSADPNEVEINSCLNAIDKARSCALEELATCVGGPDVHPESNVKNGCDAILHPEALSECSFLVPPSDAGGSGGTSATGGSGGTSATGGGGSAS